MKRVLIIFFCCAVSAFAQFGKNKVQYKGFEWYYIQSDHLDVYFSQGGEYVATFAAEEGERALKSIENTLNYQIVTRIPIIVYNSHNDFQQTNVVGEYLDEGIGGVTELFKNRVVLPFEGSYKLFRHVIHHEMTHAVINEMFYGGSIQSMISNNIQLQLPLWMNEGFAEYESLGGWDVNSDMFLRDATINAYLPNIEELQGYFAYRGGQSVWYYISQKYGKEKVGELLNRIRAVHSVNFGVRAAVGIELDELSKEWQRAEKKIYWPEIASREIPTDYATRLSDHKKEHNFWNTSPAISPNGDKVVFISDRGNYFDVYIQSLVHPDKITKLVSGQRTANFEELHLLTPGLAWSSDNRRIALAAKAGDQDAIFLIDTDNGDQERLDFSLDGIGTVAWSPTENQFAFVGNKDGQSDIYLYDVPTKRLTNLTDDIFSDADPAFSADGRSLYFSSDRDSFMVAGMYTQKNFKMWQHGFEQMSIYHIDVFTKGITRITNSPNVNDNWVVPCSDGKTLLYVSDRNGINNIYKRDLATGTDVPITNSLSGIDQLSISHDNEKLVFSSMSNAGYDVFLVRSPFERTVKGLPLEPTAFIKDRMRLLSPEPTSAIPDIPRDTLSGYGDYSLDITPIHLDPNPDVAASPLPDRLPHPVGNVDDQGNYRVQKYKISFSPDLIYGNAAYNTFFGAQGSTEMLFSDMLGDNQLFFSANLFMDLRNSNFSAAYFYLPERTDFVLEGFHNAGSLFDGYSFYRFTQWGALAEAQYPFNKFRRMNGALKWLNLSRDNLDSQSTVQYMVLMPSLSFTFDDVLWGFTSPIDGMRYSLSLYASPKLGSEGLSFYGVDFDYRHYVRFWRDYSFAFRFAGGGSFGPKAQRFAIGGVANWITISPIYLIRNDEDYAFLTLAMPMRGYGFGAEIGTKYMMTNIEFRFPLIKQFVTGLLPLNFSNILGTVFFDAGTAWNSNADFRGTTRDNQGLIVSRDILFGTGFGARMYFLFFLLKLDVAWAYNLQGFSTPQYYFSLGEDF